MHFMPVRIMEGFHLPVFARHVDRIGGRILLGWRVPIRASGERQRENGESNDC